MHEYHATQDDAELAARDVGGSVGKRGLKLAFSKPTIQSTRLDESLPEDVVAEWGRFSMDLPLQRAEVREYVIDDEALLFDSSTESLYYLNETAFSIWRICDGRTIRGVALLLTRTYDVGPETALRHVRQVVGLLAIAGLVSQETADAARG